jgi:hypothetical protein
MVGGSGARCDEANEDKEKTKKRQRGGDGAKPGRVRDLKEIVTRQSKGSKRNCDDFGGEGEKR